MAKPVEFAAVLNQLAHFGERAIVVTVNDEDAPHVGTSRVQPGDASLSIQVGNRTRTNLSERPRLTLVWTPPTDAGEYQLILDGTAEGIGQPDDSGLSEITVVIDRGILHRLADLPEPGPSCVSL